MQKKLIALAAVAAISAPTLASAADVTVYGKAFLNVESVNNNKNVAPALNSAFRVNSDASRLGFKGSEDIGGGMKAIFQYEVEMAAAGGAGLSATRNSGVGMEGGFGKVILGNWDTPYKVAHNAIELFDNTTVFTSLNLMGRANGAAGSNFNTRQSNMVQYWSPKMGALQGAISYAPDQAPQTAGGVPAGTGNKSRFSMSGTFEQDAILASVAYESRADVVPTTSDSAMRLVGKFTLAEGFWVGAMMERITVNFVAAGALSSYTQGNIEFAGQYKMGADKFAASYAKAGKTNVSNTGATQLTLRYGHEYSKNVEVFAAYTSLSNNAAVVGVAGSGGTYGFTPAFGATNLGSNQSALGAGMIYAF